MKIMKMDQENMVIFLPSTSFSLDFTCKEKLEEYFQKLFLKLEERYDIDINGFYRIEVYEDAHYGAIFDIEEEDIPYFDYFDRQVEMSIHIAKNSILLYQVEDILDLDDEIIKCSKFYQYQNHFYIKLEKEISFVHYIKLLEYSTIIYGEKALHIIKFGKTLHFNLCK